MEQIGACTEALVRAIQESGEYQRFCAVREQVGADPELRTKLNEFRRRVFEVQNSKEPLDMYEEFERIEQEYEDFRRNPLVDEFLDGELRVCRIIQRITQQITEAVDLDTKEVTEGMIL